MTPMNKPSTTTQVKGHDTMAVAYKPTYTVEQIIVECEISKKALALIASMKAVLTTGELCNEFMDRIGFDYNGVNINGLIWKMRKEQLKLNPMSDESFLDMYMLNPLQALRTYFKHSVSYAHMERIKDWGINIKDIVEMKKQDNNVHLNDAMEELYLKQL
ncbi:hypothetical protein [Paenibacillus polysaccharolyticus]|uniref:hypothetical protein n=1 Tax=Paenibacillus polysaccharolyticus TaxID=582692 RepID=UPI003008625E